jgi:hypothetical protein
VRHDSSGRPATNKHEHVCFATYTVPIFAVAQVSRPANSATATSATTTTIPINNPLPRMSASSSSYSFWVVRFANDSARREETFSVGLIPAPAGAADTVP